MISEAKLIVNSLNTSAFILQNISVHNIVRK